MGPVGVDPRTSPGVELIFQHLLGVGVLGGDQQAGGPPVQAVDGVKIRLLVGRFVIVRQKIPQSIVEMPRPRVDGHPWGLVQNNQVLVLIDDIQRPGCGDDAAVSGRIGQPGGEHLARLGTEPGVHPQAVHQDTVGQPFNPLDHRPGQVQVLSQQSVHPDPLQLRGDGQLQTPAHSFRDSQRAERKKRAV